MFIPNVSLHCALKLSLPLSLAFLIQAGAAPVVSEIMFHSTEIPENYGQEWLELHNPDPDPVDISGWRFTKGVDFTIPPSTTLAPGGYLVIAANVAVFQATHPGFTGQVVGGWVGTLSNGSEHLKFVDLTGAVVDEVHFSNEGEWALRGRGPLVLSHRGWEWFSDADGLGRTLELRNPLLSAFDCGQNWGVSTAAEGTPGAVNTVASANIAPLIKDVKHKPAIPHSNEAIVVSCNLHDEGTGATASLHWRVDGAGSFTTIAMTDTDGDGDVEAAIPAQANLSIVEWYVSATDGTNERTWPAAVRTSDIGVQPETFSQEANALVQVDDSYDPNALFQAGGSQPIYRLIMTAAEKAELLQIQTNGGQMNSDANMNLTFISHDGTGVEVHYLAGLRNRGTSSRFGPPNNYHVGFRNDDPWGDRGTLQINCRYPHSQALGAFCFERAGIAPQSSVPVRIRVNGLDLAEPGVRMYGRYVRNETIGGEWAKKHYPDDPDGNAYFLDDHKPGAVGTPPGNLGRGEFRYEGTNPAAYSDTYIKKTNEELNDYSDLITLTDKLTNTPDATFLATIQQYADLDQWLTFIATDALIGNQEGGLNSGRADDMGLYRGMIDTRFKFIPHDFDSVFAFGLGAEDPGPNSTAALGDPYTRSIFSYDGEAPSFAVGDSVLGLQRLFNHPEIVPKYYAKLLEQIDKWFNHAVLDPAIDQLFAGWVAPTGTNVSIASAKAYIDIRRTNVLAMIQQNYSCTATGNAADVNGMKQTTDGAAIISGTFNVAKTYSITVNGTPATLFYRTVGADAAGTWKLVATAGSGFLKRGINHLTANFYDGVNGTGNVLQRLSVDVYYSGGTQTSIAANGVPQVGSLVLTAPDSYVPGVPVMVRVDVRDSQGATDRSLWNGTATLTATNGVTLVPNTVTLYNGVGGALVSAGGGGGGTQTLVPAGATWKYKDDGSNQGTAWRAEGFNDTAWASGPAELGYGDGDEATRVEDNPTPGYNAADTNRYATTYFRTTFNVTDPAAFANLALTLKYDDAGIVYVNGSQVAITAGLSADVAYNVYSSANAENATQTFTVPASALHAGVNTIACEIHQTLATSSDISFQIGLVGNLTSSNPGNFTLSASANGLVSTKVLTSLNGVAQTNVSGALAGVNNWSGIVHVTGDVTGPVGASLTIAPGTHVLVDGTSTAGDTTGKKLTINGTLTAPGTLAAPISITSFDPNARWGQIVVNAAQPTVMDYCLISHAAHAPNVGHTNKGPIFSITASNVTLRDCVIGESPGKAMFTSGTTDITIQRSLITHTITGPELQDGTSLLCEDTNIQEILPTYRESNDLVPDDEDCLYIHNAPGRPIVIRRCAFAKCGDDVIDNLAGPITVEDSILRQGWDKGISLLNNDLTISRTQIIDCDKGIAMKANAATTQTVTADHLTVSSEEHDTNLAPWGYAVAPAAGDPDAPATGLWTQNKAGQSNTSAVLRYIVSNSIIEGKIPLNVDAPYPTANTTSTYTCTHDTDTPGAAVWAGTGNIEAIPLFADATNRDFRILTGSPCKNTGDPAAPLDADGSRTDMGALTFGTTGGGGGNPTNILWPLAASPFRITSDVTIPVGSTLTIEPGVSVFVDENKHILVNGKAHVQGNANQHITMRGIPGLPLKADPADAGLPLTSPKWGGFWIENSMNPDNVISYVDFIDAQDMLSTNKGTSRGCIEAKNSEVLIDHCTFRGTHLHIIYADFSSITIQYCTFPDMFAAGETPGGLDNVSEHIKMINKFPVGGHCILLRNTFGGNKGHNDVVDIDSDVVPNPILQVRENVFNGQTGDEDLDLGGDAFLDGNVFSHGGKDQWNTPGGYASAFTTGDAGGGTTIVASRNVFWDMDHATALKTGTGSIFEHNTAYKLHATYNDPQGRPQRASVITFVVPEEGSSPGDGAYLGNNIFWSLPVVLGQADVGTGGNGAFTTKLQADYNDLDPLIPTTVGVNHPGGFFSLGVNNFTGDPLMKNPDGGDFSLMVDSPARGANLFGKDLGALVPSGVWITGEPPVLTPSTSASLTVGGPGIFYYKWKLDGGAWSARIPIDPANPLKFPRTAPTIRTAQLALTGLTNGPHTVSVLGQDFAGVWQEESAATVSLPWTVNTSLQLIQINEVRADSATLPDSIEIYNAGAADVLIGGWGLSDEPLLHNKFTIPGGTFIPAGGYLTFSSATTGINLDKDGDNVYLYNGPTMVDSVTFGHQIPDLTIGRAGHERAWTLCQPTLGAVNLPVRLGASSSVRINEWFASGDVLYDNDWIELTNPGSLPVSLTGLKLSDDIVQSTPPSVLGPLSFIAANGFVKLIADGSPSSGANHLNFSLDAQQENIALFDASGELLDSVSFYPQTTDYSMGRNPAGALVYYPLPTAGFTNGTGDPAYANAFAILQGLRITEIMFNAIGGDLYDYVELRNVGASSLQLAEVKFVQGITFTFPTTTLLPDQNVIVCKDLVKFRARYGSVPVVAGVYTGKLDNGGETLALQLPPPFDANLLTFGYSDAWFPATDGLGKALVAVAPATTKANVWGDRDTWMESPVNGGDPGGVTALTTTYTGWSVLHAVLSPTSDDDNDSIAALVEYGLGMDPADGSGRNGPAGAPDGVLAANNHLQLHLLIPVNASAAQGHGMGEAVYRVQASDDLNSWSTVATKTLGAAWSGTGTIAVGTPSGGYVPVVVEDPQESMERRFMRLEVEWVP